MRPLPCDELGPLLDDLLTGEIGPPAADAVLAHLAGCPRCQAQVEELAWLDRTLSETAAQANLAQLSALVHTALVNAGPPEPSRRVLRRASLRRTAVLAASVLLAVGIGFLFLRQTEEPPGGPRMVRLERFQGEVHVLDHRGRTRARQGQRLLAEQGLQTAGQGSLAVVAYPDATRLELGPDTTVERFIETVSSRKRVQLTQGVLTVDVVKQPDDRPLMLISTHAEVVVRGTKFICSTARDATQVVVEEGRIRFTRSSDGKSIDVVAGQTAVAADARQAPDVRRSAAEPFEPRPFPPSISTVRANLNDPQRPLFHVSISPDGTLLATGGRKLVKVWDLAAEKVKFVLSAHGGEVRCVAFSPDSRTLASTSDDGTVKLWDTATGKERMVLTGHSVRVNAAAFSPDGETLATAAGHWNEAGEIFLWDLSAGRRRAVLEGHRQGVLSVSFAPDGRTLASASHDNTVRLWQPSTGRPTRVLRGHRDGVSSVDFSPDGRLLATAGRFHDRTVRLWDADSGRELFVMAGHMHAVNQAVFSPQGTLLASCSEDKTVILWDPATGTQQATLKGHNNGITSLAFSPDGRTLATVTVWDRVVKLWDVFPNQEAEDRRQESGDRRQAAGGRP